MRVQRHQLSSANDISYTLLDENDHPIPVVSDFMQHLRARGFSPNTLSAYCYDLLLVNKVKSARVLRRT